MTEKEYVLKLIYRAFLDIRVASHSHDHYTCFVLADIFHNVPLRINLAEKCEREYKEIVSFIREKCEARNYLSWLENATADLTKWS